jgi:flagellar biosynthesis protein FlhF
MQIKRFEAKNMTAALRLIKAELGTEAVILSARSIKKSPGILGTRRYSGVEVTAATDAHIDTEDHIHRANRPLSADKTIDPHTCRTEGPVTKQDKTPGEEATTSTGFRKKRSYGPAPRKKYLFEFYQQLISQGVDADIAADLTEGMKLIPNATRRLANGESETLLTSLLEPMGLCSEPIQFDNIGPRSIAFIGATGAGKTTTIAKLAAHFAIARNKAVSLVTFDDVRIGALEQIRVCARIIGVPLAIASNRSELKKHLKRFKDKDLVLIDTPGFNPKNSVQIRELQRHFEKLKSLQTQLVLSATTKDTDLIDTIKRLEGFGQRRLLFTRLDETGSVGNLLNVLIRTNIPASYFSDGQQIPDDIRPASLTNLVRILVHDKAVPHLRPNFVPVSETAKQIDKSVNSGDKREVISLVAKRNSCVYHVAGCKWTKKIKDEQMLTFESAADAAKRHYMPCRICNPDRNTQPVMKAFEGDHHMKVNVSAY